MYEEHFASTARFNTMIVQSAQDGTNVLTKEHLMAALQMHQEIETRVATVEGQNYTLTDLCVKAGGSCASSSFEGICQCLVSSILRQWDYSVDLLER